MSSSRPATQEKSPRPATREAPPPQQGPPAKKLPPEEIEKSVSRLTLSHRKEKELPELVPRRVLTKGEEEGSVKRLYDDARATHERRLQELEKKSEAKWNKDGKKLDEAEMSEAVTRLYDQAMRQKLEMHGKLEKRHMSPIKHKHLSKEEVTTVNDRLYSASLDKSRGARTKLYEKYVLDPAPKVPKRTTEQWKETSARLYAKNN